MRRSLLPILLAAGSMLMMTTAPASTWPSIDVERIVAPVDGVVWTVAFQRDGKVLAAGEASDNTSFLVQRFRRDGARDGSFGIHGAVTATFSYLGTLRAAVQFVAQQADGRIVASGFANRFNPVTQTTVQFLATARWLPDGTPDPSYGSGGRSLILIPDNGPSAMALAPDGGLLVAIYPPTFAPDLPFRFIKITSGGSVDTSFGVDGMASVDFGSQNALIRALTVLPNGKLLAGGTDGSTFVLCRFTSAGVLDQTFGAKGVASARFRIQGTPSLAAASARTMFVQPLTHDIYLGGSVATDTPNRSNIGLARFLPTGKLDPTFSTDGKTVATAGDFADVGALLTDGSGRLYVGGTSGAFENGLSTATFVFARVFPDGTFDAALDGGNGPFRTVDLGGARNGFEEIIQAMRFAKDHSLVFAGRSGIELGIATLPSFRTT